MGTQLPPKRNRAQPSFQFSARVYCGQTVSPISATAEHLLDKVTPTQLSEVTFYEYDKIVLMYEEYLIIA